MGHKNWIPTILYLEEGQDIGCSVIPPILASTFGESVITLPLLNEGDVTTLTLEIDGKLIEAVGVTVTRSMVVDGKQKAWVKV